MQVIWRDIVGRGAGKRKALKRKHGQSIQRRQGGVIAGATWAQGRVQGPRPKGTV